MSRRMHAASDTPPPAATTPRPFSKIRGVDGFVRVGLDEAGHWWLLDAEGRPFFCRAVNGVRAAGPPGDGVLPGDSAGRLRNWGFDTVGVGSDGTGWEDGFAVMAAVDFCGASPPLTGAGLRVPDVFDAEWPAAAQRHAAKFCLPLADHRRLIGWVTDDCPGWAQPSADGRPSLLQHCLSLEPFYAAYHAAWEFALALHGGRLDAMARAWGVALANKESLRELTRAEMGIGTRGYLRDEARWTREFARRYFSTTAAAIRAADPNHLVLGCRFRGTVGQHVLAECVYPAVDVAMPDWRELPVVHAGSAANPVIAGEVCWTEKEFLKVPTAARLLRFTSVEWMLRRGRSGLERAARHPAVVGYVWRQWQDDPGEQPPFARGLLHANGSEAREHTELLTDFNARAELLRKNVPRVPIV
jgi:agarase